MQIKRMLLYLMAMATATAATSQEASVLANGQWWRMDVDEEGIHRITTAELPALAGVEVDHLAVYGSGGGMLSLSNRETPIGDLQQIATDVVDHNGNGLFDAGDELLFYAEGPSLWTYATDIHRWVFARHAYARHHSYYLTTSASAPLRIATAPAVHTTITLNDHTVVAHHENDLYSMFNSGQLWMGEKFTASTPSRTVTLDLPGSNISTVKVRYALASVSSTAASFTVSTTGYSNQTYITRTGVYSTEVEAIATPAESYTFALTYHPAENSATGYLDYIELNALATMAFDGGQTIVRNDRFLTANGRFEANGAAGARVWEVTRAGREREMALEGDSWTDSLPEPRKYVIFDGTHYLRPKAISPMDNQDLHGAPAADLVIVTLPDYLEQAQRLAALHEIFDGMDALVVTDQQVFNEFSCGQQDPIAFRSLMRWLRKRYPSQPPRYLTLFGKGTFDNRNILGLSTPTLATYETPHSFDDDGRSYTSDDILGYLGDNATGSSTETLDASVGRLPARNADEARHLVDKIEGYITRRDLADETIRGDWRNMVALLADDADPGSPYDSIFAHSSEVVASNIKRNYPHLNIDRLYADAYQQTSGAIGSYYPDLNNALRQRMNYGCLLLNYIGHGSTAYIGTERYIELADIHSYTNTDRLPLLVTSTCSYGHFDLPDDLCGAEACLLADAGMVSVISASRPISHVERFNNEVIANVLNPQNTIGDALRKAKNRYASPLCIGITGDPALRLSQPSNRIKVTHINSQPVDDTTDTQAAVLSRVTVSGVVVDSNGTPIPDFDGTVYPVVYDREVRTTTRANDNPGTEVAFSQQKSVLYKGSHPVSGGRFEYSFIVPMDVSYRYDYAKLSHYAKSASDHATGSYLRLMLGGINDSAATAMTPPAIRLFMGDTNFRPGSITGPTPTLLAQLSDSAGINIGTGLGHDITAVVDNNPNSILILNDLYQADITDSRKGTVSYTLKDLAPGHHTLTLKAWNIFGLSNTATIAFTVRGSDTIAFSQLECVPNPAADHTDISLRINTPERIATAELQIFNAQGRLAHIATPSISTDGYIVGPVRWDVREVPPGLYLVRILMTDTDGDTHQATAKCIVR